MIPYHKIQTVFERDPNTKFKTVIDGAWALPEFEYLQNNIWEWTEKVDGTNIRINLGHSSYRIGGRTENAQIPAYLVNAIDDMDLPDRWRAADLPELTLYGEGYGAKIQKGGGNYRQDQSVVLFDIRVGDVWLERNNVHDIAQKLGMEVVPVRGRGILREMVVHVRNNIQSHWGDFKAEGVVARPVVEMQDRQGRRIITKLKVKDFA